MSRHCITTPQYEIVVGWDPPLRHFFANIIRKQSDSEIFTTLELPGGGLGSIGELAEALQLYVQLPREIRDALEQDREANRGNVIRRWKLVPTQTGDQETYELGN